MRRLLFALILILFVVIPTSGPALAAPARPYHTSGCYMVAVGTDVCFEEHGVLHETVAASGNTTYTFNGTFTYTVISHGEVVQTGDNRTHYVQVSKKGVGWVDHQRSTLTYTYVDAATGEEVTCITTYNIVGANGELRHENVSSECS